MEFLPPAAGGLLRLMDRVRAFLGRLKSWLPLVVLPLLLSGCVRYDLTLRFDHHTHGELQQTLALSDRGTAALAPWLETLQERSRPLGGQLRQGPQAATLSIPFSTPADLVDRFQEVFTPPANSSAPLDPGEETLRLQIPGWGPVPVQLAVEQTNWGLASRTHLIYTVDLHDLPTNDDAAPWADLHLRLQVPWGLADISADTPPPVAEGATGTTWVLPPGETMGIDVVFWLPNAIAIGSLGIAALVLAGYGLRYRLLKP
jgi:hypothetical protein